MTVAGCVCVCVCVMMDVNVGYDFQCSVCNSFEIGVREVFPVHGMKTNGE